ncbi:MAG: cell division protein FtsA [Dichotomicrobium sp.]
MWDNHGAVITRECTAAVLDLGTRHVSCMIARLLPPPKWLAPRVEHARINILGFGQIGSRGITGGNIGDLDAAEEAVRGAVAKAEHSAGVTVDEVYVTFAGAGLSSESFTASVPIAQRTVDELDIRRALLAAEQYAKRHGQSILHTVVSGYGLDDIPQIEDPRGLMGDTLKVNVLAAGMAPMAAKNIALCVERCHLRLAGLVAAPLASGLAAATAEERTLGVTCIDMGAGTTSLAAFCDGQVIHIDSLSAGGERLTRDLARILSTPRAEAERLKTLYASVFTDTAPDDDYVVCPLIGEDGEERYIYPTKADIAAIVRTRLEDMFSQLQERLEQAGCEPAVCERLVLTGGGAQLVGAVELAGRIFGGAARLGRPDAAAGLPPNTDPALAAAVGTLTYLLRAPVERRAESPSPQAPVMPAHMPSGGYFAKVGQWLRENF